MRESKKRKVKPGRKLKPMAKRRRLDEGVLQEKSSSNLSKPESSSTLQHAHCHRHKASPEPSSSLNPLSPPPPVSSSYQLKSSKKRKKTEIVRMSEPMKKRHLRHRDEVQSPFLPDDLIFEIIMRLPARSVGKFRCVSKSWLSITSSPSFIKAHVERSRIARQMVVIAHSGDTPHPKKRFYEANLDDGINLRKLPPLKMLNKSFLVASCDGLFLFRCIPIRRYCIINPLTGEFRILPRVPCFFNGFLGFYFHPPASEYRLLATSEDSESSYVITVGKSDWRSIPNRRPALLTNFNSVSVGGSLYWLAFKEPLVEEDKYPYKILPNAVMAFDKEAEVYSLLPLPPPEALDDRGGNLMNFSGELGLWFLSDGGIVDFWIKKEGWIKRYSVYHPILDLCVQNFSLLPSNKWQFGSAVSIKDEEILIAASRQLEQKFLVHLNLKTGACLVKDVEDYSPHLEIQFPHIEALTLPSHSFI